MVITAGSRQVGCQNSSQELCFLIPLRRREGGGRQEAGGGRGEGDGETGRYIKRGRKKGKEERDRRGGTKSDKSLAGRWT